MNAEDAATQLEDDKRSRLNELTFLENICNSLPDEIQQNRMRKAVILMLYAQLEGFTKTALEIYCRHINEAALRCGDVLPELATSAFSEVFKALQGSDKATKKFLPNELHELKEDLRTFAIQKTLVSLCANFMQAELKIPDKYVDMESNLKPMVLKKNLYRLALPFQMFNEHIGILDRLLNQRNTIAHGGLVAGIGAVDYAEMRQAALNIIDALQEKVIQAISTRSYLRDQV